uniref:Uncharacterized protein n=1 Tax=Anguilla anguilla TaxID=7936 RepID=A0A0E9PMZ5_ANGAN
MAETWLSSHRERKTFIWRWPSSGLGKESMIVSEALVIDYYFLLWSSVVPVSPEA